MKIKIVKKLKAKMNRYLGRVADDREPDRKRSDDCFRERMAHGFWQIERMAIRNGEFFYWLAETIVLL